MFAGSRMPPLVTALALVAACVSTPASTGPVVPDPDIQVRERTIHYHVAGATVEELAASLDASALRVDGRPFRGTTDWNVHWRFRYGPDGTGCRVTDVDVDLRVTTTVPRWDPPAEAERDLALRWAAYREALDAHEAGHRDLAVAAANEVRRTLAGLRTASCAGMSEEANARGRWVVERYRAEQRRYDRETGHGRTQGASWPPELDGGGAVHAGSPEPAP